MFMFGTNIVSKVIANRAPRILKANVSVDQFSQFDGSSFTRGSIRRNACQNGST